MIVGVGARPGEIGLWAEKPTGNYLAIDPIGFGALARNFPDGQLLTSVVGEKPGRLPFFLNTSSGGNAFQEGSPRTEINIRVQVLDEIVNTPFPDWEIAVLNIEAEALQPEVLRGASQTLARPKIVTVDAGEERYGQSTALQRLGRLFSLGFQLQFVSSGGSTSTSLNKDIEFLLPSGT